MGKIPLGPRGIRVHSPIRFKSHWPLKLCKTEKETIVRLETIFLNTFTFSVGIHDAYGFLLKLFRILKF